VTPTPEEVLRDCYASRSEWTSDRTIYSCRKCRAYAYSGVKDIPHQDECVVAALAASQERVRELERWGQEAEEALLFADSGGNRDFLANKVENLVVRWGALRGPSTAGAEREERT